MLPRAGSVRFLLKAKPSHSRTPPPLCSEALNFCSSSGTLTQLFKNLRCVHRRPLHSHPCVHVRLSEIQKGTLSTRSRCREPRSVFHAAGGSRACVSVPGTPRAWKRGGGRHRQVHSVEGAKRESVLHRRVQRRRRPTCSGPKKKRLFCFVFIAPSPFLQM